MADSINYVKSHLTKHDLIMSESLLYLATNVTKCEICQCVRTLAKWSFNNTYTKHCTYLLGGVTFFYLNEVSAACGGTLV